MSLWSGRFSGKLDPQAWLLNASLPFDQRMAEQDVRGSMAWAKAIEAAGVLTAAESAELCAGLEKVLAEFQQGAFVFQEEDEDIHTAVERRLKELVGAVGGKLHTGRSRNDQVATDFRLWMLDHLPVLKSALRDLQSALVERAEADFGLLMPGYTHLQRAQPILLSHWWLSHFWALQRDVERLADLSKRVAVLPLGCGALAGTPFNIDRDKLAAALGFLSPSPNSLDAVSDRDFAAEFLFVTAMSGTHLSRFSENMVLFTTAEFGFFELSDAYSTGSSLMPQKKNPDMFELGRGKAGTLLGLLTGLMATLKGLPSTYDKDLQEDKPAVFAAFDTLTVLLPVLANAIRTLKVNPQRMRAGLDPAMLATDLADYLVEKNVPFREAHSAAGKAVAAAAELGTSIEALSLETYQSLHPGFGSDVYSVFDAEKSVSRRKSFGGTAPEAVKVQIEKAKKVIRE
ncbi:MAG: argininosuccinate lyase [Chloroflexi bacterium HGW-Chloroflexi-6]|nr:MAG: argininosuccinate lyase [Chloroflexi bacterium HGW-Chloroflexi-6]